ncbi:hypothetical protein AVEN_31337-1, partial [Araneus ventricosus]
MLDIDAKESDALFHCKACATSNAAVSYI